MLTAHAVRATPISAEPTPTPVPSPDDPECVQAAEGFCRFIFDVTGNSGLAHAADWLVAKPLAILLVVLIALGLRFALRKVIDRVVGRIAEGRTPSGRLPEGRTRTIVQAASPLASERRRQRSQAMGSVLKSIASFVIVVIAALMILSELGLDVGPALASAGIAGVALGFGAQNLVKDFLAGMFMIFEDQYGVGDVITAADVTGTVEAVGLRVTRLQDERGVVWYVRNGEVTKIGNRSQGPEIPEPAESTAEAGDGPHAGTSPASLAIPNPTELPTEPPSA